MLRQVLGLILLFFVNAHILSQEYERVSFSHISLDKGLSQSTIFDIEQDKSGFMWFATYDGLNKYNGYDFTIYRYDPDNESSLGSDIVRTLYVDLHDRLWIGTRAGLSLYESDKESFRNFKLLSQDGKAQQINRITDFDEDCLLLSTNNGLFLFDTRKEEKALVPGLESNSFVANTFLHVEDKIYIGLTNGLIVYDKTKGRLERIVPHMDKMFVHSIIKEAEDRIWVATEDNGLFLLDEKLEIIKNYRAKTNDLGSISSDHIRSLVIDNRGVLWVGTFVGLDIYDKNSDSFHTYMSNPVDNSSVSQNSIRSIFKDDQGGIWCGTYFGGLNYYHSLNNRFGHIKYMGDNSSINDKVVSCIVEDADKNLWIGTNDKGVNFYNTKTKRYTYYMDSQKIGGTSNNVKSIYIDEKTGLVYVGTHAGGLSILNRRTGNITNLTTENSGLCDNNVYSIIKSPEEFLWIGTLGGLMRFNPQSKTFEKELDIFNDIKTSQLYLDSKKRLWVGSEEGLIIYSYKDKKIINIELIDGTPLLKNAFVNCITETEKGDICFGTRNGMFIYSESKGNISHFTTADGLPNNVVYGILEDGLYKLWMSTNNGLACYTPYSKSFKVYNKNDRIQSSQFNTYSYCKTQEGLMYFGGVNGINVFHPEKIVDNPYTPNAVIDKLLLFNKTVYPGDQTNILEKSISETSHIELSSKQSSFSLEFVVANYTSGQSNNFAYMLGGFDEEWIYTSDKRVVTYTNLDAGDYVFKVKVANNDGVWSKKTTELRIKVLPVWWRTWWATLLFAVAFIIIGSIIIRTIWFRKLLKKELKMEQLDKIRQEELSQTKTRFFINISHELRTPLTLIKSPLEEIINHRSDDKWLMGQMNYIKKSIDKLLYLINQIMDYRRAELGAFELKVVKDNLNDFVYDQFLLFESMARRKKIDFSFDSNIMDKTFIFSPQYVGIILSNLLSNAFKYTSEGGKVTVTLNNDDHWVYITVSDTGKGIPMNQQERIFERFYQTSPDHSGSGVGLSLVKNLIDNHFGKIGLISEEGVGSSFSVKLPQDEEVYKNVEFISLDDGELTQYNETRREVFDDEQDDEVLASIKDNGEESEGSQKETILIVEDNVEILDYLKKEFKAQYNVIGVEDGVPALDIVMNKGTYPDLIITDVMLPEVSGLKLCKAIKQNIHTCHIPVIIISAKTDIEDQLEGLQVGADDYILKPFSISILQSKIQNILKARKRTILYYSKSNDIEPEKITFNAMDEELIKKATEIVKNNMDNISFSVDDFSREMAMSRSNLHLKLKAITGESTIDFIRKIRFNEACRLLREGRYNVSEVGLMVGFNSPSYFATSFKKYYGVLPSEYVKSLKK